MSAPGARHGAVFHLDEALQRLDGLPERFVEVFRRGSLAVELYCPVGRDPQQPHRQDELYVVMRGQGRFVHGEAVQPVRPGDVLFVPAGMVHRFESFTADFAVWVIFYGPEGGEAPAADHEE